MERKFKLILKYLRGIFKTEYITIDCAYCQYSDNLNAHFSYRVYVENFKFSNNTSLSNTCITIEELINVINSEMKNIEGFIPIPNKNSKSTSNGTV